MPNSQYTSAFKLFLNYPSSAPQNNIIPYIQGILEHPNTIPIYVYDDFNEWGAPYYIEGQMYYTELDGIKFPDTTNMTVFFGRFIATDMLSSYYLYVKHL